MNVVLETSARGLTWTTLSFIAFAAAPFAVLPIQALPWFSSWTHDAQTVLWSVVWGVLALVGVLVAARFTFGRWLPVPRIGLALAGMGVALSAVVNVVLQQWEVQRFGIPEPELVGLTAGLFAVLIGLAAAVFGSYVAPPAVRAWPIGVSVAGAAVVLAIVVLNAPGLGDGLSPESWPLAIWIGLAAVYAVAAGFMALRRLRYG